MFMTTTLARFAWMECRRPSYFSRSWKGAHEYARVEPSMAVEQGEFEALLDVMRKAVDGAARRDTSGRRVVIRTTGPGGVRLPNSVRCTDDRWRPPCR